MIISCQMFHYDYDEPVTSIAANFHDAALLYATAVNESLTAAVVGRTAADIDGCAITDRMTNRTIQARAGRRGNISNFQCLVSNFQFSISFFLCSDFPLPVPKFICFCTKF